MALITFGNNIASLNAQRRLNDSSKALRTSFERLSSGLRINHAGDDAAGLSIASGLNVDSRVFSQAIRNINDGTSLLNVADGALTELENVAIRLGELTEQSSNGTLSNSQRSSLNTEANALVSEYNRIVGSTTFNGVKLLDGSFGQLAVQAGYGANGKISFGLGTSLSRNAWDGTFGDEIQLATDAVLAPTMTADFNNDGNADIINFEDAYQQIKVFLGNGDGTFRDAIIQGLPDYPSTASLADFNGDGKLDMISSTKSAGGLDVYLGNGDGTFSIKSHIETGNTQGSGNIVSADFNRDGRTDFVVTDTKNTGAMKLYLGNGDGTFSNTASFGDQGRVEVADFNNDGKLDLLSNNSGEIPNLRLGNGNGTFLAAQTYHPFGIGNTFSSGDFNGDGLTDLAITDNSNTKIFVSNGDGSYKQNTIIGFNNVIGRVGDFDGDGVTDLLTAAELFIGNGDGTFRTAVTELFADKYAADFADFNNDGVMDVLGSAFNGNGALAIRLANTYSTTNAPTLNIGSKVSARNSIAIVRTILNRVVTERGNIGAKQARLQTALSNLDQSKENLNTAYSRIVDADIAEESATLVKNRILQQAGLAVLAQANAAPELALSLLSPGRRRGG